MYNKAKVKEFQEDAIEDYNRSLIVENIVKVYYVGKTDGAFTQVGIKPVLDDEIFTYSNSDPRLPSAGRIVAIGERDFLIKSIINNEEIERIEFNEDIKEFPKHINSNEAVILLSTKFFVGFHTKFMHRIDYEEKGARLDFRYRIIPVPEKVLGSKIIIVDKMAVAWEKKIFENKITGKKEMLEIVIEPRDSWKVAITIRTLNKIKFLDPKRIKILEVGEWNIGW